MTGGVARYPRPSRRWGRFEMRREMDEDVDRRYEPGRPSVMNAPPPKFVLPGASEAEEGGGKKRKVEKKKGKQVAGGQDQNDVFMLPSASEADEGGGKRRKVEKMLFKPATQGQDHSYVASERSLFFE